MTDLMILIQGRRSIRKYEDRPVPAEALGQVLEAVRWAPSWANTQCWEVVAVQDAAIKARLQGAVPAKGNPSFKAMTQAPVVLVLCAKIRTSGYYSGQVTTKFGDWMMYDLGLATQNLCLMAHNLGLGTVVVGLFDHDQVREILQVPDGYEVVTMIPLGYPAKIGSPPKRKEIDQFVHRERWST